MGLYLERLCIFFVTSDFLLHFLPKDSYKRLYKSIVGIISIILILQPILYKSLGTNNLYVISSIEFEENLDHLNDYWDMEKENKSDLENEITNFQTDYLEEISEEDLQKSLKEYGYEEKEE